MLFPAIPSPPGAALPFRGDVPVGAVIAFAGAIGDPGTPHALHVESWGWMLCDGRQLAVHEYPELHAVLGQRYAQRGEASEQATMFRIPDYRGYFLRGVDGGAGVDPDAGSRASAGQASSSEVGSIQQHALQKHEHEVQQAQTAQAMSQGAAVSAGPALETGETRGGPRAMGNDATFFASDGETRPKNVYVHFLIKYSQWPERRHLVPATRGGAP